MTKRFVAALLTAAAILPGVAQAQDRGLRDRDAQAEQRRDVQDAQQDYRRDAREARQDYRRNQGEPGAQREYRQDITQARRDYRDEVRDARQDARRDGRDDGRFGQQGRDDGRFGQRGSDARNDGRFDQRGWNGRNDGYRDQRAYDGGRGWNRNWRNEGRYDWNRYRAQNRSAYRLPRYYAPATRYGSGYRRYGVGLTLGSQFFGQNYWISDPYAYRLPPAYGQYRWVRYYDDALLIDLRSGQVFDTTYGIFWR